MYKISSVNHSAGKAEKSDKDKKTHVNYLVVKKGGE